MLDDIFVYIVIGGERTRFVHLGDLFLRCLFLCIRKSLKINGLTCFFFAGIGIAVNVFVRRFNSAGAAVRRQYRICYESFCVELFFVFMQLDLLQ